MKKKKETQIKIEKPVPVKIISDNGFYVTPECNLVNCVTSAAIFANADAAKPILKYMRAKGFDVNPEEVK